MCDCNICPCPVSVKEQICSACRNGLHFPKDIQKQLKAKSSAKEIKFVLTKELMKEKGGK